MATAAYHAWVRAGRPWRLATPIAELQNLARRHGVRILGTIGDQSHLQDATPEDHTPFSIDAWPGRLPGYVVCAIDLDSTVGFRIVEDARAGRAPWAKYVNVRGNNYDVRNGWRRGSNSDQHTHISIRTDWIDRSIGAYNPFTGSAPPPVDPTPPPSGGDLDMDFSDQIGGSGPYAAETWRVFFFRTRGRVDNELPTAIGAVAQQVAALSARVDKLQTGGIDLDAFATQLAAKLPAGNVSAEEIRRIVDEELDESFRAAADQDT